VDLGKAQTVTKNNTYMHNLEAKNRELAEDVSRLREQRDKYKKLSETVSAKVKETWQKWVVVLKEKHRKKQADLQKELDAAKKD
jgi:hypothetical protein